MFILNWIREYYELKMELAEKKRELEICNSCETLKMTLAIANQEKEKLLARLLEKPEPEPIRESSQISLPKTVPWYVRRQMLEKEDREKARLMRNAPKPQNIEATEALETKLFEQELDNATASREANNQKT